LTSHKMNDLIKRFLDKKNVFAVVGASRNTEKYGFKIYQSLKEAGYTVYPVNPNNQEIDGDKCFPSLRDLPVKPDVVNLVVPPEITEKIVEECLNVGVKNVWMQPGSESQKALDFCSKSGIKVLNGVCVMVEKNNLGGELYDG